MAKNNLPLKEVSIEELFSGGNAVKYEIPIYQRNYAWESDEIRALVQDVKDAYIKDSGKPYYIGTLVTYHKGEDVYEVIDGQQRLTTIRLLLDVLEIPYRNKLTYRARKKSDRTLKTIDKSKKNNDEKDDEERDYGIENGFKYAQSAVGEIISKDEKDGFKAFFRDNVRIIRYKVPKDIDLNHYFEIMNSRGEQLEKHEIVKAKLMEKLESDEERRVFNIIWECCSEMSVYTQKNLKDIPPEKVFGKSRYEFLPRSFEELITIHKSYEGDKAHRWGSLSIDDIISGMYTSDVEGLQEIEKVDSFQPIMDFPNFLLIVLKIVRMEERKFDPIEFTLDDKELLNEFDRAKMDAEKVRFFAYMLLKSRFLLDNFVVHHSKEEDRIDSNPWKLQVWYREAGAKREQLKNLIEDNRLQDMLVHILSMFEVSFTARQRKNYLFYILHYLLQSEGRDTEAYAAFAENLADRYFLEVYLDQSKLNAINTPTPGSFDEKILGGKYNDFAEGIVDVRGAFTEIYGDGTEASRGVPLFIFNYLDYKLWRLYDEVLRGEKLKEGRRERNQFFEMLGCGDFGLKVFDQFYFSRTRRSLEHYFPQANVSGEPDAPNENQINCFGNYAMIGSEANSAGSNWSPKTKLDHYLDRSRKISQVSVASLKFMIMMKICDDKGVWGFEQIREHQGKMVSILAR